MDGLAVPSLVSCSSVFFFFLPFAFYIQYSKYNVYLAMAPRESEKVVPCFFSGSLALLLTTFCWGFALFEPGQVVVGWRLGRLY